LKQSIFFAASVLLLCGAAAAAPQPAPDGVTRVTAAEQRATVARTKDGLVVGPVSTGNSGAVVLIVRRDRDGEVEVHANDNDVFVAREGTATVTVGGRAEGGRETSPVEHRGGTIIGGRPVTLAPGDVLWIPAGVPHRMTLGKSRSFTYIATKIPVAAPKP
jgi:mannose-6-phosphate isomerase-like protein (cupin superfamily)